VLDQEGLREVREVMSLSREEYEPYDIGDILALCQEDYDFSGELDDFGEYCFWKLVDDGEKLLVKSDEAKAVINNIITYAVEHFDGEDLYYFVRNILYDVICF